mmetsp:Transcript_5917/g.21375  ORF Transcript_5917/g.21375 Transcript_5917/m.21375 type:complete len:200 (-) Transcript_5917:35-634(-)
MLNANAARANAAISASLLSARTASNTASSRSQNTIFFALLRIAAGSVSSAMTSATLQNFCSTYSSSHIFHLDISSSVNAAVITTPKSHVPFPVGACTRNSQHIVLEHTNLNLDGSSSTPISRFTCLTAVSSIVSPHRMRPPMYHQSPIAGSCLRKPRITRCRLSSVKRMSTHPLTRISSARAYSSAGTNDTDGLYVPVS